MRTITITWRRWLVAIVVLIAVGGTAACSGMSAVSPRDISASATIAALSCQDARAISNEVSRLASASAPGERAGLRNWGLDPDNAAQLESTRNALLERVKRVDCADTTASSSPSATASATAAPSPTTAPTATDLPDFVISMPRRDGNRLNADGVDPANRGNAEAFRKQIAEQAKHDPLTLYHYYMASPYGKADPLINETVLAKDGRVENGNVFSPKGEEVYRKWSTLWLDPVLTQISAVSEIKYQGANTGVTADNKPTQSAGVGGTDKSGYDVTYVGGNATTVGGHSALDRCTQPTHGGKLSLIPEGSTDNKLYLEDKDISVEPNSRGNAGNGGGRNADQGPGERKSVTQPPAAPRTNPPAPRPTSGSIGTVPAPNPNPPASRPTPPPESGVNPPPAPGPTTAPPPANTGTPTNPWR